MTMMDTVGLAIQGAMILGFVVYGVLRITHQLDRIIELLEEDGEP